MLRGNKKKCNFTQCEVEVIVGKVEKRRKILFGGHSVGITNAKKALEWQKVADAVNAVASQPRVEAKKRLVINSRGGQGVGRNQDCPN